jgi:hypothetical protein
MMSTADDVADRLKAASAWLRARLRSGQRAAAIVDTKLWLRMLTEAEAEIQTLRTQLGRRQERRPVC